MNTPITPAGWYPHPDQTNHAGKQMYWDGAQWIDGMSKYTDAPATEAVATPAPKKRWYKRKRIVIPLASFAAIILISGIGSSIGGDEQGTDAAPASQERTAEVKILDMTGQTVPRAVAQLEGQGFDVKISGDATGGALVIAQIPNSGSVEKGSTITITGEVPAALETEVPDFIGLDPIEAAFAAVEANVEATLSADDVDDRATVIKQSIEAGTVVDEGTVITLTFEDIPEMTISQENAVDKAKSYLSYSGFSRLGLIGQLEFEGYSHKDSVFGADNAGADWNAEAAEKAQSYLDYSSFSRQGLYDQMAFEEFTHEQIEYALKEVGY